ncbi:MAG: WYL domain-containing protein [Bacteroidota bacterium]
MAEMTMLIRALRILQRLSTHDDVTVKELHDYFGEEESKQTIQRTIRHIEGASIPLRLRTGPHNEKYYSLDRSFQFIPQLLTPEEVLAAVLLLQFREVFAGTRLETDMLSVFDKLTQLLPDDAIAVPDAFSGGLLHVHQPGLADLSERSDMLRDLFEAIVHRRVAKVRYRSKQYKLHPYSLLLHNGALYIIGRVPPYNNSIYFALPRFRTVELTDDTFERDPAYSLSEVLKDSFGIWYETPEDVVIRFAKTVRGSIESRQWHPSQKMSDDENGDLILRMRLGPSNELIAWILRWGEYAEVLEPVSLRDSMRSAINRMSSLY